MREIANSRVRTDHTRLALGMQDSGRNEAALQSYVS